MMNRFEEYKAELAKCRSQFVAACVEAIKMPLPDEADYAGLYYQVDDRSLLPVRLTWITLDRGFGNVNSCPFSAMETEPWVWTDDDLDLGLADDAEEYFFQWASDCWNEAGGRDDSPLFVLCDHGSMDIYDLVTLEELTDEEIERRVT